MRQLFKRHRNYPLINNLKLQCLGGARLYFPRAAAVFTPFVNKNNPKS